jgi:hypothetical protein
MNRKRILLGLVIGVAFVLMVRWAPLLTPLVIGIVVGCIVGKPRRGAIVGAAVGVLGNAISFLVSLYATSGPLSMMSGVIASALPNYMGSSALLFAVFSTIAIIIGGAVGGWMIESRIGMSFHRGVTRGEELERIKLEAEGENREKGKKRKKK